MLFAKLFQSRIVFGKKDLENDSLCIVGTRKELLLQNCLYYAMLSYINVLGIDGPNYLVFYK